MCVCVVHNLPLNTHTHTHTHTHTTHHTQLKEMEQERIAELDTTLGKPGAEEKARHRLASGAGDLLSTAKLSIHNLEPDSKGGRDLGEGLCLCDQDDSGQVYIHFIIVNSVLVWLSTLYFRPFIFPPDHDMGDLTQGTPHRSSTISKGNVSDIPRTCLPPCMFGLSS